MSRMRPDKRGERASILHDIAAPLMAARGWAELLGQGKLGAEPSKWVARLNDCLAEIAALLASEGPAEAFCPVEDLESLAASMDRRCWETGTRFLCSRRGRGPWKVRGPRAAFRRIAANLLSNVLRHAPGGWVEAVVLLKRSPQGWRLRVEVADEGPGLGKGAADGLFRAGRRGKDSAGKGLGLHLVRELARANGGEAGAIGESRGARFWAEVAVREEAGKEPAPSRRDPVILAGLGPRERRWLAGMLTGWRIPCATVTEGAGAAVIAAAIRDLGGAARVLAQERCRGEQPRGVSAWIDLGKARPCGPGEVLRLLGGGETLGRLAKRRGMSSVGAPDAQDQGQAPA